MIIYENDNVLQSNSKIAKKKKQKISATLRRLVWNTHIGEEIGKTKCLCCKLTDITQLSFTCGHIIAEANNGQTIVSNLKPICQYCNSSMGTQNMDKFIKNLKIGQSDVYTKRDQLCKEAFEKINSYVDYISSECYTFIDKKRDELRKEAFEKKKIFLDYMSEDDYMDDKDQYILEFEETLELLFIKNEIEFIHKQMKERAQNRHCSNSTSQADSSLNS